MATTSSAPRRQLLRRQATVEEALDHAVDVMSESGVGALSVSEVARRTGRTGAQSCAQAWSRACSS